jgi:hypothetical protein
MLDGLIVLHLVACATASRTPRLPSSFLPRALRRRVRAAPPARAAAELLLARRPRARKPAKAVVASKEWKRYAAQSISLRGADSYPSIAKIRDG